MKITYSLIIAFCTCIMFTNSSIAQWTVSGTDIYDSNTGNVGIGTSTPNEKIHIKGGGLRIEGNGSASGFFAFYDTSAIAAQLQAVGANFSFTTYGNRTLKLISDKNVELNSINGAIKFNSASYTRIGAASYFLIEAQNKFEVSTGSSFTTGLYQDNNANVGIKTNNPLHDLHVIGDVAISGEIIHPSDKRLKENIKSIDNALAVINKLEPKTYNFTQEAIDSFSVSDKLQFGLIAQEVEKVIPIIIEQKALQSKNGDVFKGLNYEQLIPLLVSAVKELTEKNMALAQVVNGQTKAIANLQNSNSLETTEK